jgi:hypothetical protein
MAYASTMVAKTVFGDKRVHLIRVTPDATSGTVDTGLSYIDAFAVGAQSCTTTGFRSFPNSDAANSNTVNGEIGVSGAVSGDVFFYTVYGR